MSRLSDLAMPNSTQPTIYWFRRDLRLQDNPALHWAVERKEPVICLYIHDNQTQNHNSYGEAAQWWLHHSLDSLQNGLKLAGNRLRLFSGSPEKILVNLAAQANAKAITWNRRYEPASIELDKHLKSLLTRKGLTVQTTAGNLCHEPWQVGKIDRSASNRQSVADATLPYRVFTAYWRASLKQKSIQVTPSVKEIPGLDKKFSGEKNLKELDLLPDLPWADQFSSHWQPGEKSAGKILRAFVKKEIKEYDTSRDLPALSGTSRLSPHLAFGEITPRQINAVVARRLKNKTLTADENTETFLKEIGWREFAYHLLYHFPHTTDLPLDTRFNNFPWNKPSPEDLRRWQQGNTGIPLIDAGMRQLWQTGWMHNRVRMVVGSLLVKNLGYHWLEGARWFLDTLLDADLASNTMGWQWVAGSGADAAPYFRIFNPVRQGERFDPDGEYIRQWVPEIAGLSKKSIHSPWAASETELSEAGIKLGQTYPHPIVDLKNTRVEALERFAKIKTAQRN